MVAVAWWCPSSDRSRCSLVEGTGWVGLGGLLSGFVEDSDVSVQRKKEVPCGIDQQTDRREWSGWEDLNTTLLELVCTTGKPGNGPKIRPRRLGDKSWDGLVSSREVASPILNSFSPIPDYSRREEYCPRAPPKPLAARKVAQHTVFIAREPLPW
jgi:hypothetical protein